MVSTLLFNIDLIANELIAPDMKIYCMYGVGVPTERSYYYAVADEHLEEECTDHNSTGCTHEATYEHAAPFSEYDMEAKSMRGPHLVSIQTCAHVLALIPYG